MTPYHLIIIILVVAVAFVGALTLMRYVLQRNLRIRSQQQTARVFTIISHELLTPLTVIAAQVERLREQVPGSATDCTMMELNVERMTRLLEQMLDMSRSQTGELRLLVSHGDVMEYIRRTALSIEPLMHKRGVEFAVECTPMTMMGWIDTDKLDKIIYCLLANAAKYTSPPGHVNLLVNTNDNYDQVIVTVSDDGTGISPEKMKRLFHSYQDDDSHTDVSGSATGMGLMLTRNLVQLHKGTISCESEEGKGTTFTVVLPIAKKSFTLAQIDSEHPINPNMTRTAIKALSDARLPEAMPTPTLELPTNAPCILLVESNLELMMTMVTQLCEKYRIMTATDGREALDQIRRERPDLIVSDVIMPQMDGIELTKAIKSEPETSQLPVILLTTKTTEEAMVTEADDYIVKPFRLNNLMVHIDSILERMMVGGDGEQTGQSVIVEKVLTPEELFIKKATDCVLAHLSDGDFDRDAFAAEMGASPSTLYNKLRQLTGQNVSNFIRDIRMKEARRMADTLPDLRVSDLAYKVGFKDPKYFATCFKKEFGIQPSELLRGQKNEI